MSGMYKILQKIKLPLLCIWPKYNNKKNTLIDLLNNIYWCLLGSSNYKALYIVDLSFQDPDDTPPGEGDMVSLSLNQDRKLFLEGERNE